MTQAWDELADRYFDEAVFPFSPSQATQAGFHAWDGKLEDFSAAAQTAHKTTLRRFGREVQAFTGEAPDRELILSHIGSGLLALEEIRMWEKNPDLYSTTASNAAFVIMSREFAPAEVRLRALISRERQIPALLGSARANLKNPPRIYTEVAIEQMPGIVTFFENDVPLAFAGVTDPALLEEFRAANAAVVRELTNWLRWLESDLLPRSNGDFRIGAENYRKKLLYDEMIDIPLDRILELGYEDLRRNQRSFIDTARQMDPTRDPREVFADIEKDHPAPDHLLQAFRDTLAGLRDFVTSHHIAGMPSQVLPRIEETPPFMRALTFASLDMPGPYETATQTAFFNVTLPEANWAAHQVEEHLAAYNHSVIISTSVHEAYPGHYLQGLWLDRAPSKAAKLIPIYSNVEGWAHYCEQMMMDEGYGGGDLKLRLGQLQEALLRNARYVVGIEMHTGRMTVEQAVDFFVSEGFQTRTNGEREAKRGASDPTYLCYTLGKLLILKLREDYRRLRGPQFTLEEFHDNLLSQGMLPFKMVRRAMLGVDSPLL